MNRIMSTIQSFSFKLKLFALGVLLTPFSHAIAQGDLLISPLRIVFEGQRRSQEINLANVGKDTASYTISVVDYRMNDDGSFDKIDSAGPGQQFAGPYLRFFPRKVTLAPNEAQVVKIQVIKTNELSEGEYRSHLYFRSVPDEKPLGEKDPKKDTTAISIQLTPIFGITIPVIIRVGESTADVTLSPPLFYMEGTKPMLHASLNRTGNMSVYGDIKVEHITGSDKATEIKLIKGVGVYTPNPVRNMNIELDTDKGVNYHSGKIRLTYTVQTNSKTPKVVEAEVSLK